MEVMQNGITMEDVGFCYDKKTVVKGFSAHFEKGGKYALTGPSGRGKSTLLKLILGCLPEYTGSIRLDNQEIKDCSTEQLWQQIGYIGQDVFLFNTTVLDNITLGGEFAKEHRKFLLRGFDLFMSRQNNDAGSHPRRITAWQIRSYYFSSL